MSAAGSIMAASAAASKSPSLLFHYASMCFFIFTTIVTEYAVATGGGGDLKFWVLTDVHLDKAYSTRGSPENFCRESANVSGEDLSGFYGDYRCDSPSSLFESALGAMKTFHPNPDFILLLGDNLVHEGWAPRIDRKAAYSQLNEAMQEMLKRFGNVTIYPAVGNNDNRPSQLVPENDHDFYEWYLTKSSWNTSVNTPSMKKTFTTGGYYSTYLRAHLNLIMLNTALWLRKNTYAKDVHDPADQFKWLEEELKKSQQSHDKVILAGHASPGYYVFLNIYTKDSNLYEGFNDRFVNLILNYSRIIAFQLYSHDHGTSFRLYTVEDKPVSYAVVTSSVAPNYHINPTIQLFTMNPRTFQLKKYVTYSMNLTGANEMYRRDRTTDVNELWKLFFDTSSADDGYNLQNLDIESWSSLYNSILSTQESLGEYTRQHHAGLRRNITQMDYVRNACAIKYSLIARFNDCFNSLKNQTNRTIIYETLRIEMSDDAVDHATGKRVGVFISVILVVCLALIGAALVAYCVTKRRKDDSYEIKTTGV